MCVTAGLDLRMKDGINAYRPQRGRTLSRRIGISSCSASPLGTRTWCSPYPPQVKTRGYAHVTSPRSLYHFPYHPNKKGTDWIPVSAFYNCECGFSLMLLQRVPRPEPLLQRELQWLLPSGQPCGYDESSWQPSAPWPCSHRSLRAR